jgi:hypothetical protein
VQFRVVRYEDAEDGEQRNAVEATSCTAGASEFVVGFGKDIPAVAQSLEPPGREEPRDIVATHTEFRQSAKTQERRRQDALGHDLRTRLFHLPTQGARRLTKRPAQQSVDDA